MLARQHTILQPAGDTESLKTPLYAAIGEKATKAASDEYHLYHDIAGNGIAVPGGADASRAYAELASTFPCRWGV